MTAKHRTFAAILVANIFFLLAMVTKMVAVWRAESDNKNVKIIQLMRNTTTLPVYHIFGTFL